MDPSDPTPTAPARTLGDQREGSFASVLAEHGASLRRAVTSYERDPGLQEDLYQDVCLALWRALRSFRGDASLRTFALRIAHNRGVSHLVRQARRRERDVAIAPEQEADLVEPGRGPESEVLHRERAGRLRAALHELPLSLRQAVALRLEGLALSEIAEVLGISENAVSIRLTRAKDRLEDLLARVAAGEGAASAGSKRAEEEEER